MNHRTALATSRRVLVQRVDPTRSRVLVDSALLVRRAFAQGG
jgi:hypothetical protein